jgi:molybdenum-dependent DNA-binding transcriptional regulator ModE
LAGGGARFTATGREVLKRYRAIEVHAAEAVEVDMQVIPRVDGGSTPGRLIEGRYY